MYKHMCVCVRTRVYIYIYIYIYMGTHNEGDAIHLDLSQSLHRTVVIDVLMHWIDHWEILFIHYDFPISDKNIIDRYLIMVGYT